MKNNYEIYSGLGIPFRDKHAFTQEAMNDIDIDEESGMYRDLMRLKMKEATLSDEERTSPDTFGCNKLFLEHFVTVEMEDDFSLIARDFLLHEYQNIKDYDMVWYLDTDPGDKWPDRLFICYALNLMMNAVNSGSVYAKNLFLYLHKTYYRKEYQMLKRFQKLSGSELMDLARNENGNNSPVSFARILAIARMYGIEISLDCNFVYLFLNYYVEDGDYEPDFDYMDRIRAMHKDCEKEIEQIFENKDEMYAQYWRVEEFIGNVLRAEGYVEDYVPLCNTNDYGINHRLARTLAILKKMYKGEEFAKEELLRYANLYEVVQSLISTVESMDNRINEILFGEEGTDRYDCYPPLFRAEEVMKGRGETGSISKAKVEKKAADNQNSDEPKYKEESLLAEIDALHRKIHQQEGDIKELRGKVSGYRKLSEENESLREQMAADRRELSALREHIYNLTESEEQSEQCTVDDMKQYLKEKRMVIIGGHSNWRQKMKEEFPHWIYIEPNVSGTLESSVVDKADRVYFFTDTLSHSTYFKYMNVVKEHGIDFGYIHGVNIENNIRKIYKDLKI